MHLGFGLYRHQLTEENFAFARQCGATHLIVHLVDYLREHNDAKSDDQPRGEQSGFWGYSVAGDPCWETNALVDLRRRIEAQDLVLAGIENLEPADWHDVLLDGPGRDMQVERVQQIIRNLGAAGIPCLGYNFSIGGVCGRITGNFARGGAQSVGMSGPVQDPIPRGVVWNMIYDEELMRRGESLPPLSHEDYLRRYERFLADVLPVAEEAGVTLGIHPEDPPVEPMRGQPRLVRHTEDVLALSNMNASPRHKVELCIGTVAEMPGSEAQEVAGLLAREDKVAYVHLRNIVGRAPDYRETFIDEGKVNVPAVLEALRDNGFEGVVVPDHAPSMSCKAPWHAGMAFSMGYILANMQRLGILESTGNK